MTPWIILAYTSLLHKPKVTERKPVRYIISDQDFYMEDEDRKIFKLSVKKEQNPTAAERFKSGNQQCQPQ